MILAEPHYSMAELKEGDISAQLNDQKVLDKKIETLVYCVDWHMQEIIKMDFEGITPELENQLKIPIVIAGANMSITPLLRRKIPYKQTLNGILLLHCQHQEEKPRK